MIISWSPPSAPHVLFTPTRPGALFQALAAGPEWIAWIEHVDTKTFQDARVYAARRDGGERVLIDDMIEHGSLVTFPELALDGADLYWTIPQSAGATWQGLLRHQNLVTGQIDTVESGQDTVFTWPSARHGTLAYEVTLRTSTVHVRYVSAGRTHELPAPASEPSIGEGYIIFKHADRYSTGNLAVAMLDSGAIAELGAGEAPHADGSVTVWSNGGALGGALARPTELCVAQVLSSRMVNDVSEFGLASGDLRLAWVRMSQSGTAITELVRTARVQHFSC